MNKSQYTSQDIENELNCPDEHRSLITQLLNSNLDLLAKNDSDLSQTDTVTMKIETGDHPPIKLRPYRTPLNTRKIIDKAVDEMLAADIIERSRSSWSFPVIIVEKKDGSSRFCVDYRKLNKVTRPIAQPLPLIDDIINRLSGAKYFSSLALKSGYWQVKMDEQSRDKTAFTCHRGLFSFKRMPFGLSQAPAYFTELMNEVLTGLDDFATSYLDDVLIWSSSLEEHLTHIQQVLDKFRQHNLKLKLKKCNFLQKETVHLGFVISKDGVKPDMQKVAAIRDMPSPSNVREVRGFMGSVGYYRRFIPNFSKIAQPLINLTKKNARFRWSDECQTAFEFLKESLTVVPLLAYPNSQAPYKLFCDSSADCIGSVLTQECEVNGEKVDKPIYFLSHKLSPTQCRYSTVERECYAIYYALQKLHTYLHNANFEIYTDHKPLKYLLESPMQNKRIQMWALSIQGYNAVIRYLPGRLNTVADLLSRTPGSKTKASTDEPLEDVVPDVSDKSYQINTINSNEFNPKNFASCNFKEKDSLEKPNTLGYDMVTEQSKDPDLCLIKTQLETGQANKTLQRKHIVLDNILYYMSNPDDDPIIRLYVPKHLTESIVKQVHDIIHLGLDKTFDVIRAKYYWPNLYKHVYEYVSKCVACQTRNLQKVKTPLGEVDTPPFPFAKIALDMIGPLPRTLSSNVYILSAIDWYSGYVEAWPLPDKKADGIAHIMLDEIIPRHGCPLQVVTDGGLELCNSTMAKVFESLNITHVKTTPYSPWQNGKCERSHRALMDVLSKKIQDSPHTWDLYLNQALAALRFSVNESTKLSPHFLLYQRDPVLPIHNLLKPRRRYYGDDIIEKGLEEAHKSFVLVHRRQKQARRKQAKYADAKSKDIEYKVGQPVYFKNHKRANKLDQRWKPFYRIIKIKTPEGKTPKTFIIRDQLTGQTVQAHADHLRLANIDEWEIPKEQAGRKFRRANYVIPPEESDTEDDVASSESESESPEKRLINKYRKVRSDSENEMDIPLAELSRKLREKEARIKEEEASSSFHSSENESAAELPGSKMNFEKHELSSSNSSCDMEINHVSQKRRKVNKPEG
ncbi:MAG: reverse transcriptase domain-containing protein, partial [Candidatus Thiodiazotropha sp.]